MTRQEFIKLGGAGIVGILTAKKAPAVVVRSAIGGKSQYEYGEGVNPNIGYIQQDLIALYDGIYNNGWGSHSLYTQVWKNIMGDPDLDFDISGMIVGETFIDTNNLMAFTSPKLPQSEFTIEVVGRMMTGIGTWDMINYFLGYGSNGNMPFGFGVTRSWATILFYRYGLTEGKCDTSAFDSAYNDGSFSILRSWSGQSLMDGTRKLYKNGVQFPNSTWIPRQGVFHPSDNNSLMIGVHMDANGNVSNCKPRFILSCLRFYSRALTEDEVLWNYSIDAERFGL